MKIFLSLSAFFLLWVSHAGADSSVFRPVINEVIFSGDYVTFGEAKPRFRPVHQINRFSWMNCWRGELKGSRHGVSRRAGGRHLAMSGCEGE